MKKLPIGIQNFRKIIEGNYIYADKTQYVYNLLNDAGYVFLSRPRRFGKSLLLDTIAEVFGGNKELFKGLWIYESDYDFRKHPVIRLDMSNIATDTPDVYKESVLSYLDKYYAAEGLKITDTIISDAFSNLIMQMHRKYNERVVVLIDEYDKPILDHITDIEIAKANRNIVRNFYGILKSMDPHLRFVMMTGVSRFTKTSVFSELNNMIDITMSKKYANICGITIEDLDNYFEEYIRELSGTEGLEIFGDVRTGILRWYDGYSWDGRTRVLNPFSLLCFFQQQQFMGFWYDSGTPGFLVSMIAGNPGAYANINGLQITADMLSSGDLDRIPVGPLMFQSGYLTVKEVDYSCAPAAYTLEMPNLEVKDAFNRHVLAHLADKDAAETRTLSVDLRKALRGGDLQKALSAIRRLFASIPYQIHVDEEAYYHSIVYALMSFTGLDTTAEVSVADGRVDAIVEYDDKVYVIEFKYKKCEKDASEEIKRSISAGLLDEGMKQIEQRGYYKKYIGSGKAIYKAVFALLGRSEIEMRHELIDA